MTKNEKDFVKALIDNDANVRKAQGYIKENFGIDSEYDEENCRLRLICNDVNESMMLLAAREYISSLGNNFVETVLE